MTTSPGSPASMAAFGGLITGTALSAFFLGHPVEDGDWTTHDVRHVRSWWAMHFYGGLGSALMFTALGVLVVLLCRYRGQVWAAAAAALLTTGGMLFGLGVAMEGAAFSYATEPAALPAAQGEQLMAYLNDSPGRYLTAIMTGTALIAAGWLAVLVALWRSRAVPRALVPVLLLGLLVSSALPFTPVGTVAEILLVRVPAVVIGVLAVLSTRTRAAAPVPVDATR